MSDVAAADWQTLDIAAIATVAECRALSDALTKEMAQIDSQLELADARREIGESVDPIWYARAKTALKYRGRTHQILSQRLGELSRASRQADATRLERFFIDAAREILPPDQFANIWEAARRKLRG